MGTYEMDDAALERTVREILVARGTAGEDLDTAVLAQVAYVHGNDLRMESDGSFALVVGGVRLGGRTERVGSGSEFRFTVPKKMQVFFPLFDWPAESMRVDLDAAGELIMYMRDGKRLVWKRTAR